VLSNMFSLPNYRQPVNKGILGCSLFADRLKITVALSYFISHLAWSCSYYEQSYANMEYDGKTMLYWCKREVKWAIDYLLRTHVFPGTERPSVWNDATDKLVLMVRVDIFRMER
jgi:hypothetical protein